MILIAKVVPAIGAILYFGGVTIPKILASIVACFYGVCVAARTGFCVLKKPKGAVSGKLPLVDSASAILILLHLLAACLGVRRTDRDMDA